MVDYPTILSEIFRPFNIIFFCFGVFATLMAHSIRNKGNPTIILSQNEVFIARLSHWAGFFAIILCFSLVIGPGGWVYEDMVYLVKHSIILNQEYISEVTMKNVQENAMICAYGECMNRTIICTGNSCYYLYPKNETDAPHGEVLFSNFTTFDYNGTLVVIKNQTLPRKAEIR